VDHKNLVLAERDLLPAGGVGYAFDIVVLILTLNFGMCGAVLVAAISSCVLFRRMGSSFKEGGQDERALLLVGTGGKPRRFKTCFGTRGANCPS
jgi:hypothetical protein